MTHRPHMALLARIFVILWIALALPACDTAQSPEAGPIVLAASSLQDVMTEIADEWAAQGHDRPTLSFAGTPALARQAQNGAPADIALLADEQWMDVLEEQQLLIEGTRRALLGNRLVLITQTGDAEEETPLDVTNAIRTLGDQRLAMADPDTVPAGRYAKAALVSLGLWDEVQGKIAPTENVRAALALVERGEAPLALVYESDLVSSSKVRIIAEIPDGAQPPIRYPGAILTDSIHPDTEAFFTFLQSPQAEVIFEKYRFRRLAQL